MRPAEQLRLRHAVPHAAQQHDHAAHEQLGLVRQQHLCLAPLRRELVRQLQVGARLHLPLEPDLARVAAAVHILADRAGRELEEPSSPQLKQLDPSELAGVVPTAPLLEARGVGACALVLRDDALELTAARLAHRRVAAVEPRAAALLRLLTEHERVRGLLRLRLLRQLDETGRVAHGRHTARLLIRSVAEAFPHLLRLQPRRRGRDSGREALVEDRTAAGTRGKHRARTLTRLAKV